LEQRAIETTSGAVTDVLDRSLMAQSGIAQAREQAPVTPIADLLIEQQSKPFRMGERCELMKQIEGWMSEQGLVS
jgi:hypothetical protein